ncbi:MAG: ABC transporter permease [Proteobacteria bacterium]|nr:ABC transporter permease [Pseudomonadota bacterium]
MNLPSYLHDGLINIMASKLRSFLALLGILVGTASVVALISCGQLATEKALDQFKALGTDLLAISVYQKTPGKTSSSLDDEINLKQWQALKSSNKRILELAPYSTTYQNISFQGKPLQGAIIGANESLAKILNIELSAGHFVSFVDSYEHYCVLGANLAMQLRELSYDEPIGKQLRIGNNLYTIIGIASHWKESSFFNEDINNAVIVPLAGMALVSKDSKINNAVLLLEENTAIDPLIESIKSYIEATAPKLAVFPRSAKQIIASMENQGHIFTWLLAIIGSISLLVGGIGIMNIMLVSVSERKKEIGIRKAVGAKNSEIQQLFLVESVLLSFLGGIGGVILGLIFTRILAYFSEWPFHILLLPSLAGFIVSVATGIFFGFYPAKRAANLTPIECLRV